VERRGGCYAVEGGSSWEGREGTERSHGLLAIGKAGCCEGPRRAGRRQGAALGGRPAFEHAAVGSRALLRHLALLPARAIRGKQTHGGTSQGLELKEQEEGGDEILHSGLTLMIGWRGEQGPDVLSRGLLAVVPRAFKESIGGR